MESLSANQAQKVTWVLRLVRELDVVPNQYFKKLVNTDDLWEVRAQVGGNIFRLLGFFDGPRLVILNHAFAKKTQKTPLREVSVAERRKQDSVVHNFEKFSSQGAWAPECRFAEPADSSSQPRFPSFWHHLWEIGR